VQHVAADRHGEPWSLPLRWRIVSASSSAWVGCSWLPSPALMTAHRPFRTAAAPHPIRDGARPARRVHRIQRHRRVDQRLALAHALTATAMLMTSAPNRLPATSNEVRVAGRVLKKQLITVRPRSRVVFLSACRLSST